ncbi:zf-HC2 domain-containing protein [Pendulispora rubella]|uniref:Zf-HC2 domain-containing protein n=1 Tax=Pendulispora rubella TaxID=2741070 RepID=A0ABZ2L9R5_9BACT
MIEAHVTAEELMDFVQGQLAPVEERRIEQHANGCSACAKRLSAEAYLELAIQGATVNLRQKRARGPWPWLAAAAMVAVVGGGAMWKVAGGPEAIRAESELGAATKNPWHLLYTDADGATRFATATDPTVLFRGSPSRVLRGEPSARSDGARLAQRFQATKYLGKRVRLSAWLRTEGVTYGAGLSVQAQKLGETWDKAKFRGAEGIPPERAIKGTTDWAPYELTFDVSADASIVIVDVFLDGGGRVWVAEPMFEIVGPTSTQQTSEVPGPVDPSLPDDFRR